MTTTATTRVSLTQARAITDRYATALTKATHEGVDLNALREPFVAAGMAYWERMRTRGARFLVCPSTTTSGSHVAETLLDAHGLGWDGMRGHVSGTMSVAAALTRLVQEHTREDGTVNLEDVAVEDVRYYVLETSVYDAVQEVWNEALFGAVREVLGHSGTGGGGLEWTAGAKGRLQRKGD